MKSKEEVFQSICTDLSRQPLNRHEAAALGYDIVSYLYNYCEDESLANELRSKFNNYIILFNYTDLLDEHVNYAIKLALAERELIYEEILKLFYLCDEIQSLATLGLEMKQSQQDLLKEALLKRFDKQFRSVKIVAKQNCEQWKSQWWWYQYNIVGK